MLMVPATLRSRAPLTQTDMRVEEVKRGTGYRRHTVGCLVERDAVLLLGVVVVLGFGDAT